MPAIIEGVRALALDLNNTLLDTDPTLYALDRKVAREYYGRDLTEADYLRLTTEHRTPNTLFPAMFGCPPDDWEQALRRVRAHQHEFPRQPYPGTVAALNRLLDGGIKLTIITGNTEAVLGPDVAALGRLGLRLDEITHIKYFEPGGGPGKPDAAAFDDSARALAALGIGLEETWAVGDDLSDLQFALAVPLADFIGVTSGRVDVEAFAAEGVAHIIPRIDDLPGLVLPS